MSVMKEFKDFAVKGNVVDMAVGIIIGGAFGTIVKSLVADIIMPPIGLALGGLNFGAKHIVLRAGKDGVHHFASPEAAKKAGAVTLNYGTFLNNVISFLIVAFCVFVLVKAVNKAKREEPAAAPDKRPCDACTMDVPLAARRCPYCTTQFAESAS